MSLNKMYFALSPNKLDISIIMKMRPKNILISYAVWCKQNGKNKLSDIVQYFWDNSYHPNIILDSGAYTFRNDSQESSFLSYIEPMVFASYYDNNLENCEFDSYEDCLLFYIDLIRNKELDVYYDDYNLLKDYPNFLKYIDFIEDNKEYINYIIALDDINNEKISKDNWFVLQCFFKDVIPTFHYGENLDTLDYYINNNAKYIALGGVAVAKKNGASFKNIINWVNDCALRCPDKKLHLFGCQDGRILKNVAVYSADGTSWIISAGKKYKKLNMNKFDLDCDYIKKYENY